MRILISACLLGVPCRYETVSAQEIGALTDCLLDACCQLEADLAAIPEDALEAMVFCRTAIVPHMAAAREAADRLETRTDSAYWPFPGYAQLLFSV